MANEPASTANKPLWIRLLCRPCTESQLTLVKEGLAFWWPKWGLICYPNVRGWAGGLTHLEICVRPIKQPTNKQIMIHNTLKKKKKDCSQVICIAIIYCWMLSIRTNDDQCVDWQSAKVAPHPILTKKKYIGRIKVVKFAWEKASVVQDLCQLFVSSSDNSSDNVVSFWFA